MKQIHTTGACVLFALLSLATPASAQSTESFAIGVIGGPGWPGSLAALRIAVPVTAKAGFDVDAGRVFGLGVSFAGHLQWHWRGRSTSRASPYAVFGVAHVKTSGTTTIVWPDQVHTVIVHDGPPVVPQFGIGADWLSPNGVRAGIEATTGGTESGGPVIHLKFFVLWGPPQR